MEKAHLQLRYVPYRWPWSVGSSSTSTSEEFEETAGKRRGGQGGEERGGPGYGTPAAKRIIHSSLHVPPGRQGDNRTAGLHAAVFFVFFYCFWWCFFMDATQYIYIADIFPNHLRTQGVVLGIAFFYLASEVTLVAAPVGLAKIGWKFYLVLIGRALERIGALFGDDAHVAVHWYDATEEEREKMAEEALRGLSQAESSEDKVHSSHLDFAE
ncbi:hypothetical protein N7507_007439 [Penicillium longicatenatum]|nr:hypothetical protein N7507_007439 [Penicillium longicatenatum]